MLPQQCKFLQTSGEEPFKQIDVHTNELPMIFSCKNTGTSCRAREERFVGSNHYLVCVNSAQMFDCMSYVPID